MNESNYMSIAVTWQNNWPAVELFYINPTSMLKSTQEAHILWIDTKPQIFSLVCQTPFSYNAFFKKTLWNSSFWYEADFGAF